MKPADTTTIDDYIRLFPGPVQKSLRALRAAIRRAAPDATEAIKYRMPTFVDNGNLVHFAAYDRHIGFYPAPSGVAAFRGRLGQYRTSKGAIQFPLDEPVPIRLVTQIVTFRLAENRRKRAAAARRGPRTTSRRAPD